MQVWFCDGLGRCALSVQRRVKGEHGVETLKTEDMRKLSGVKHFKSVYRSAFYIKFSVPVWLLLEIIYRIVLKAAECAWVQTRSSYKLKPAERDTSVCRAGKEHQRESSIMVEMRVSHRGAFRPHRCLLWHGRVLELLFCKHPLHSARVGVFYLPFGLGACSLYVHPDS